MSKETKVTVVAIAVSAAVFLASCAWVARTNDLAYECQQRTAEQAILIKLYSDRLNDEHERLVEAERRLEEKNKKAETGFNRLN